MINSFKVVIYSIVNIYNHPDIVCFMLLNLLAKFQLTQNPKLDFLSGLTVALALVPEAIAFAFVAGVEPLVGLYAAFFVGIITSIFGGRSGMISGATGAMAVVMVALVAIYGVQYLFATIILTGIIQIIIGILRLGKFINIVPTPVMLGFVNGLAIVIFLSQIGQFKSPDFSHESDSNHSAINVLFNGGWLQGNQLFIMILLTLLTMGIIFLVPKLPKLGKLLPSPLVSIIIISFLVIMLKIDTLTVGDLASVSGGLPEFSIPSVPFSFETLLIVLPFSLTLAGIGLIESLLTLTLIDEITETKGKPNKECFGQGLSNVTCGFFGAMGGCAMIGQSMINISSGGRGRLSGIVAAVSLLCFILFFSKWIEMIPIAALTGIMMMVVIGTFAWASLKIINKVPKQDAIVIILVTFVTVWQDLAIAVVVGVIFSALSYSWKSSSFINLEKKETISKDESVYILKGSLFFGSINKFKNLMNPLNFVEKTIILDCSEAWIWDQSSLEILDNITTKYKNHNKLLKLHNLGPSSHNLLKKSKNSFNINIED